MSALSFVTSALRLNRGTLFEYGLDSGLLMLDFEFNPSSITHTRTVSIKPINLPGMSGGHDFQMPSEAPRAAQSVAVGSESLNMQILLDATDRMDSGDPMAAILGIQPELDVIRAMLEPKSQQSPGAKILSALGMGSEKSSQKHQTLPVLIFKWGMQSILPVFMTQAQIVHKEFLPTLIPYRAEVTLNLQVIESENPFYTVETLRRSLSAMVNIKNNLMISF